jgi:hypothetical protein
VPGDPVGHVAGQAQKLGAYLFVEVARLDLLWDLRRLEVRLVVGTVVPAVVRPLVAVPWTGAMVAPVARPTVAAVCVRSAV